MTLTELWFVFRRPVYPVICDLGTHLAAAQTGWALRQVLERARPEGAVQMVDRRGEQWTSLPEHEAVSPSFFKRSWKKRDVIALFNASANAVVLGGVYPERVIPNRTLERIIVEIAALVRERSAKQEIAEEVSTTDYTDCTDRIR